MFGERVYLALLNRKQHLFMLALQFASFGVWWRIAASAHNLQVLLVAPITYRFRLDPQMTGIGKSPHSPVQRKICKAMRRKRLQGFACTAGVASRPDGASGGDPPGLVRPIQAEPTSMDQRASCKHWLLAVSVDTRHGTLVDLATDDSLHEKLAQARSVPIFTERCP